jgi:hypothetical protein
VKSLISIYWVVEFVMEDKQDEIYDEVVKPVAESNKMKKGS